MIALYSYLPIWLIVLFYGLFSHCHGLLVSVTQRPCVQVVGVHARIPRATGCLFSISSSSSSYSASDDDDDDSNNPSPLEAAEQDQDRVPKDVQKAMAKLAITMKRNSIQAWTPEMATQLDNLLTAKQPSTSAWQKVKNFLGFGQHGGSGVGFMFSYRIMSNSIYGLAFTTIYYLTLKRTGMCPMFSEQRHVFRNLFLGFYVFNKFLRPLRIGGAFALAPTMERLLEGMQRRWKISRSAASGVLFLLDFLMLPFILMVGIGACHKLTGIPLEIPDEADIISFFSQQQH